MLGIIATYPNINFVEGKMSQSLILTKTQMGARIATFWKRKLENLTVSSLLVAETNAWNEQLIRSTFNPHIAAEILKIKLSSTPRPDQWIWRSDKYGKFSVKSPYRTTQSIKRRDQRESSNPSPLKQVWPVLWKMKVPHKV